MNHLHSFPSQTPILSIRKHSNPVKGPRSHYNYTDSSSLILASMLKSSGKGKGEQSSSPSTDGSTQRGHEKLRAYEAGRKLSYAQKLDTSTLYWQSFRDMLAASVQETGRAQRLVLGTSRAHQLYADAMEAMYEDTFLDDKGNAMLKQRQQKKLSSSRKLSVRNIDTSRPSVLTVIRDAQHSISQKFGENAKNMDMEISDEIGALLQEFEKKFSRMRDLGNGIVAELEKIETEVSDAWSNYYTMAVNLGLSAAPVGVPQRSSTAAPESAANTKSENSDLWLVEAKYRLAVAYQQYAWEKASAEFEQMYKEMKSEECFRRMNLREFLVAFVQRQQRLFMSLPAIHNQVLEELVGREMSREQVQELVDAAIDEKCKKLREEYEAKNPTPNKANGTDQDAAEQDLLLESPLLSDLLIKAEIVEKKSSGMMTEWKTSLIALSTDSYLHIFEINSDSIYPGDSIESAFSTMIPPLIEPSAENVDAGKQNFGKTWSDSLTPSESVVLGSSSLQVKNDNTFEITETTETKGASKMFGKKASRKLMIRTTTKDKAEEWLKLLRN